MLPPTTIWKINFQGCEDSGRYLPLQYAEVKDDKGRELYEGDIVRCNSSDYFTVPVKFLGGIFYGANGTPLIQWHHRELLGNIYETPELMEGKNVERN